MTYTSIDENQVGPALLWCLLLAGGARVVGRRWSPSTRVGALSVEPCINGPSPETVALGAPNLATQPQLPGLLCNVPKTYQKSSQRYKRSDLTVQLLTWPTPRRSRVQLEYLGVCAKVRRTRVPTGHLGRSGAAPPERSAHSSRSVSRLSASTGRPHHMMRDLFQQDT